MPIIYTVFNHETKTESIVTEEQLENLYPELKSGTYEIVDEIDTNYTDTKPFTISYESVSTINQCIASLWEVIAYQDILTNKEVLQILENNLKQIDSALKCVES